MTERTCIVTRMVQNPDRMIRFVAGPEGEVVPDMKARLPGRGVWVTRDREIVEQAIKRKAFARGLQMPVKVEEGLADQVETLLLDAALGALGFARKAGELITGAANVENALRSGKALAALHASDGAEDGLRKLRNAATAFAKSGENDHEKAKNIWRVFTSEEMSLALGATNVIHASIMNGHAGRNLNSRVAQLAQYRKMEP